MDVLKDVARRDKRNVILNELSEEDLEKTVGEYYFTYIEKPFIIKDRDVPKFDKIVPKFGILKNYQSIEIGSFLSIDDLFFSFDGVEIYLNFNNVIHFHKDERQIFYSNIEYQFKELTHEECNVILEEFLSLQKEWNKLFDVDMGKLLDIKFPKRIVKPQLQIYLDRDYMYHFLNLKLKDILDKQTQMFGKELEQYEKNVKLIDFLYHKLIYTSGCFIIPTAKNIGVSGLSGIVFGQDFSKNQIAITPEEDDDFYIFDDETAEEIKKKINELHDKYIVSYKNLVLKIETE